MKEQKNVAAGRRRFYSNGKLLLSGEYFVLKGAKSLGLPTTCGQDLEIERIEEPQLIWSSYSNDGVCWLEAIFELPKLRLISASFDSHEDGGQLGVAEKLFEILLEIRKMNSDFLNYKNLTVLARELINNKGELMKKFAEENKDDICLKMGIELYELIIENLIDLVLIHKPDENYIKQVENIRDLIKNTKIDKFDL